MTEVKNICVDVTDATACYVFALVVLMSAHQFIFPLETLSVFCREVLFLQN